MSEDEVLLYLYRNVGLLWEKELCLRKSEGKMSLRENRSLKEFIKAHEVIYHIVNTEDISSANCEMNTFYLTKPKSSEIGSLLKHLRNAIMHGNYVIDYNKDPIEIEFFDLYNKKTNMKGIIMLDKLIQLINCINNE